jgi:amidase
LQVLAGYDAEDPASVDQPVPDYQAALAAPAHPPRLGVPRRFVERAEPETVKHLDEVAARCRSAGADVVDVELPPSFADVHEAGQCVVQVEAAAFHAARYREHADRYREHFRATLAAGMATAAIDYVVALRRCRRFRRELEGLLPRFDALLLPVAPGPAPAGLASTGDAAFCAPWSSAGVPAIALPSGLAPSGLPLGVQLVAAPWRDAPLVATARWVEDLLAFRDEPPGLR